MDPLASFDVNGTLGAIQIGVSVSYVLFGVATTQTYIYYSRFPDDSRMLKALTAFVWFCDIAHTLCLGQSLYTFTILDYAHPERLAGPPPRSLCASTLFSGLTAASVQAFFSYRIYSFNKKVYIPSVIWFMAFLHLSGRIVIFITSLRTPSLNVYVTQWEWLITTNWIISVVSDVVITTTLVVILHRQRSDIMRRKTAALVDKLILWTIETGMLTSASSILMLAFFVGMKSNYVWIAFYAITTRLFSNSLLARRVGRSLEQETLRTMNQVEFSLSSLAAAGRPSHGVQVKTERQVTYGTEPHGGKIPENF
ncbi:hypothetical protein K438DRAFT_1957427 [Mycena galopus ATCC 62051]|nr:hypothetical protein K438DRAFT_1957427 [Mycena galopus ATCC 62051]